jgi:hypothetical protein
LATFKKYFTQLSDYIKILNFALEQGPDGKRSYSSNFSLASAHIKTLTTWELWYFQFIFSCKAGAPTYT